MNFSATSWGRVYLLTFLGTIFCIGVAFAVDSYSFESGSWRWGSDPVNNLIIPLLLAPPFLFLLLNKNRQLAIAHRELMTFATTDSLTALLNRRAFTELVDGYLERVEEASETNQNALLVIDVDHFKMINDRYGHDRGDEALKIIAQTIRSSVRDTDLVGRMGGEEFSVFIPKKRKEIVHMMAERIRAAISEIEFKPSQDPHPLSVSIGGVIFDDHKSFQDIYRGADEHLYAAKNNGRNRVELSVLKISASLR